MPSSGDVANSATLAVNAGGTGEWTNGTSGGGTIGGLIAGTGGQGTANQVTWNSGSTLGIDTTNAGGSLTYAGVIGSFRSGPSTTRDDVGLNKLGTGTLVLSTANSFTGGVVFTAGTLGIGDNGALGTGKLTLNGGQTINPNGANRTIANAVDMNSGPIFNDAANNFTFTGPITVINAAAGQAVGRTINMSVAGTVTFGSAPGSSTITVGNPSSNGGDNVGKTLTLSAASGGTIVVNDVLQDPAAGGGTASGTVLISGTGTVQLNGQNTFTGGGTLSGSQTTLIVGSSSASGSGPLGTGAWTVSATGGASAPRIQANGAQSVANNITLAGSANVGLRVQGADNLTLSGNISSTTTGGASITKVDAGTLTLSGTNTYTGTTNITGGTLQLGNGGTTGSLSTSSAITDNGNLTINRSNAVSQGTDFSGGAISGTGSFTQAGSGTTTLNAANTYSGATNITGGTLSSNNASGLGTLPNVTISTGATLNVGVSQTVAALNSASGNTGSVTLGANELTVGSTNNLNSSFAGVISDTGGSGTLVKAGTGTLVLSGNSTYGGGTTISAGVLQANNTSGSATGSGSVAVTSGGTLAGTGSVAGAVFVNGGGTIAPGTSVQSLALGANLTFNNTNPNFAYQIDSANAQSVTAAADLLTVGGSVSISSTAMLNMEDIAMPNVGIAGGTKYTLINYFGTLTGTFSGKPDDSVVTIGVNQFTLNYDDVTGGLNFSSEQTYSDPNQIVAHFVTITTIAIPEASSWLFGCLICAVVGAAAGGRKLLRRLASARNV